MKYYITRKLVGPPGIESEKTTYLQVHEDGCLYWVGLPGYATKFSIIQARDLLSILLNIVGECCSLDFVEATSYVLKGDNTYYTGFEVSKEKDLIVWSEDIKEAQHFTRDEAKEHCQAFKTLFDYEPDIEELS